MGNSMIHQWIVAGNRGGHGWHGWARPLVSFGPIPASIEDRETGAERTWTIGLIGPSCLRGLHCFLNWRTFFSTMVYMVSCFDLNWKLLALPLWEPVSHAQKRMMSLVPRVPQALLVNIRNGYPDTHGRSPFLLIFPVPTNDLPWKHLRCIPIGTMVFPRTRIKGCFWVVFAGTWRYPWLFHEDLWSTLTIQLQIHEVHLPNWAYPTW